MAASWTDLMTFILPVFFCSVAPAGARSQPMITDAMDRRGPSRLRPLALDDAQSANRQFVDLQHAKTRLLDGKTTDRETTDCKATDRQRTDGDRTDRRRTQRKRQQIGGGTELGRACYFARHWQPPRRIVAGTNREYTGCSIETKSRRRISAAQHCVKLNCIVLQGL
jgi:hypothetical protein